MSAVVLYGHPDSGHACKVALALGLAEIAHRPVWVDIWADPTTRPRDFLAASPFAEVPLLLDGDTAATQSGAILIGLATRLGRLGGESVEGLRRGTELILWEANRIGMCLPQLIEVRRVKGVGFPPAAVEWLAARYAVDRDRFDRLLGAGPFFHGAEPGIGDCAIWGYVQWVERAGMTPSAAMESWRARMRALPAMRAPEEFFPS